MAKVENGVLTSVDDEDIERLNNGESWESVFGPGITEIGENAFYDCINLTKLPDFPEGMTKIGESAFSGCTGLKELPAFPKSLTEIGESAFEECTSLEKLTSFPDGLKIIGACAFLNCPSLKELPAFPDSLTEIGESAFAECTSLEKLTSFSKALIKINEDAFNYCKSLTKLPALPEALTTIGKNAFADCASLTEVPAFPEVLTEIEENAFSGCTGLKELPAFPKSLIEIGESAFEDCTSLEKLTSFPDGLKIIGASAFRNCASLKELPAFPNSLTEIGESAFEDCTSLEKLTSFPKSLTEIGENAFYDCINLTKLPDFPEGLTTIGESAFADCSSLTKLPNFPKGLQKIKTRSFAGCKNLREIVIPKTVTKIEEDAFYGCDFNYYVQKKDGQSIFTKERVKTAPGDVVFELNGRNVRYIHKDENNNAVLSVENENGNIDILLKDGEIKDVCSIEMYNSLNERNLWEDYAKLFPLYREKIKKNPIDYEVLNAINKNPVLADKFFNNRRTGYDILRKKEWYEGLSDESKYDLIKLFVSLGGFEAKGQKTVLEVIDGLYEAYGENFNNNIHHLFMDLPKGDAHVWGPYGAEQNHCFCKMILNFLEKNKDKYNTTTFKFTISKVVTAYPLIYQAFRKKLRDLNPEYEYATEPNIEEYEKQKNKGVTCEFVMQYVERTKYNYLTNIDLINTLSNLPQGINIPESRGRLYEKLLGDDIPKIIQSVKSGRCERNKCFINAIDDDTMVVDDNPTGVHYEWAEINKTNALTCAEHMQTCFRPNHANRFAFWNCLDNPEDTFMMLYDGNIMMGYCRVRYYPDKKGILVDNVELSKYAGIRFTKEKIIELSHRCEKGLLDMAKAMNEKGFQVDRIYSKQDEWADQTILEDWKSTHLTIDQVKNAQPMEEVTYKTKREEGAYHANNVGPQIILYDKALELQKNQIKGMAR